MSEDLADRLRSHLNRLLPEALSWLEKMVGVNSFTANPDGVNALGKLTAECFADLGFIAEHIPSKDTGHGSHLFLSRGNAEQKPVLLVTHLDTVFPPEEEVANAFRWEPSPAERRIYGPGTVDIKGGTALIWLMLQAMRECQPTLFESTRWMIAANSSEEVRSTDFARCVSEGCPAGARAVLVFEGGPRSGEEWHIVTSRKGRAEYRINAVGKAAHAGSSHADGINAIVALCQPVMAAAALTDPVQDLTVNVARISGGTVLNRVPHEAWAELEMRAFDPQILKGAGDAIVALSSSKAGAAGISVSCLGISPAWKEDSAAAVLAQHWHHAAASLGRQLRSVSRGGLSDANYLCHLGPTLDGLGPSGGNAHCSERTADGSKLPEYVETDSFVPRALLNLLALESALR
jgi:glutamate carboxypeptidase